MNGWQGRIVKWTLDGKTFRGQVIDFIVDLWEKVCYKCDSIYINSPKEGLNQMKRILFVVPIAMLLVSCKDPPNAGEINMANNKPVQIAEADGVRLWKVRDDTGGGASYVYFTSGGDAFWQRSCGKNCTANELVTREK